MENEKRKYWFFGSKLNSVLLLVLIILMVIALKWMSQNKEIYFTNEVKDKTVTTMPIEAAWFVPNQDDSVLHTATWKVYNLKNITFSYPSSYVVSTKKIERRPGTFGEETTIVDPNSKSAVLDTIYVGVPYVGANDPYQSYQIKENVNGSGIDFAISLKASSYAKYIFANIVASVSKH